MNKTLVVAVIALVVAVVSVVFPRTTEKVVETVTLGATGSGQQTTSFQQFAAGLSDGGDVIATSSAVSSTLRSNELMRAACIDYTITNPAATTLTLPATSTLVGWMPAGSHRLVCIRNATTSASVSLTIAAGTGMTIKNTASSSLVIPGDTDGQNGLWLRFYRNANGNYSVFTDKFTD